MSEERMIRVGGMWSNTSKNGRRYLSGRWGSLRILAFENTDRRGDNSPDFDLFLAEVPPEQGQQRPQQPRQPEARVKRGPREVFDDDLEDIGR